MSWVITGGKNNCDRMGHLVTQDRPCMEVCRVTLFDFKKTDCRFSIQSDWSFVPDANFWFQIWYGAGRKKENKTRPIYRRFTNTIS